VRTDRQTDRITDADDRYTDATTVVVGVTRLPSISAVAVAVAIAVSQSIIECRSSSSSVRR